MQIVEKAEEVPSASTQFAPPQTVPSTTGMVVLCFAILYIVWGTTYLAIKIGVGDESLPPFLFGGSRIGSAGVILLVVQLLRGQSLRVRPGNWKGILLSAGFLFIGGNGFISAALRSVNSGESAVLAATATLWIALFSMCFPGGDRLRPLGWLGLFLGILGVAVLQAPALRDQGFSFATNVGPWLVLGSAAFWGIGAVLLRQMPIRMARLTSAGYQMALGGSGMILVGLAIGERPPATVNAATIGAFVYLLVFGSLIAFLAFQFLLEHVPATKVATYAYVNPLVAVLLGVWWRGEPLTLALVGGMALILFAVFLVRGGGKQESGIRSQVSEANELATPDP
jgi:drug/metabolite transporter (DMT)-like permease